MMSPPMLQQHKFKLERRIVSYFKYTLLRISVFCFVKKAQSYANFHGITFLLPESNETPNVTSFASFYTQGQGLKNLFNCSHSTI